MEVKKAEFVCSNTRVDKLPAPNLPEYAFIGRSNVGKSSLINAMTNKKGLAKTSQKPGKTQLINHFIIDDTWYLWICRVMVLPKPLKQVARNGRSSSVGILPIGTICNVFLYW